MSNERRPLTEDERRLVVSALHALKEDHWRASAAARKAPLVMDQEKAEKTASDLELLASKLGRLAVLINEGRVEVDVPAETKP